MKLLFWVLLAFLIGWLGGWRHAHITVADECERLGKFFVGDTVFECTKIKKVTPSKEKSID
ncbi:MAG: hypothetical protein JKY34_12515 [Kordiimonadaceae bacterium]|nr:hypothetical protein [Kordiimonadaceae bacterium]PCJ37768.1 MAG: hypothetical protein COA75_03335 [Cellvibrionales bacterium]